MWECGKGQTDRHRDAAVANINFASVMRHAKCNQPPNIFFYIFRLGFYTWYAALRDLNATYSRSVIIIIIIIIITTIVVMITTGTC